MYNVINEKTGKVFITLGSYRWERDEQWRERINKHLKAAGISYSIVKVEE